jgi:hypothetical protein
MGSSEVMRRHPPHHLSPTGATPGRARPRSAHSPLQSHHSNAPIEPVSQSNLSKIVALSIAIAAPIRSVRSAFRRTGRLLLGPHQRGRSLSQFNQSGSPALRRPATRWSTSSARLANCAHPLGSVSVNSTKPSERATQLLKMVRGTIRVPLVVPD